jgi:hypothetical protein
MNYVLDENCTIKKKRRPDCLLTAREFIHKYSQSIFADGIPDHELIRCAKENDYVIITRDKGMVIKVNKMRMDIIYIHDNPEKRKEQFWFFITKNVRLKNSRATLDSKVRKRLDWVSDFDTFASIMVIG